MVVNNILGNKAVSIVRTFTKLFFTLLNCNIIILYFFEISKCENISYIHDHFVRFLKMKIKVKLIDSSLLILPVVYLLLLSNISIVLSVEDKSEEKV